jgi:ATP/maltotriose-dependent transcriptional regulator MalT
MAAGGDARGVWRLAAAIGPFIFLRGPYGQALRLMAEAGISSTVEVPEGVSEFTAGVALQSAGAVTFLTGDFVAAVPILRRSVELLISSGDQRELARSRAYLGLAGISTGDPSAMVELATARISGEELGDLPAFAIASAFSGEVAAALGDFEGAREFLKISEARCREADDRWLLGFNLIVSGSLAIVTDDIDHAIEITEEAYAVLATEQPGVSGWPLIGLAYCHMVRDELDVSQKYFDQSIVVGRRVGDKTIVLAGLMGLAGVAAAEGDPNRAARLLGASDAIREALGYQLWSATARMYDTVLGLVADSGDAEVIERERSAGGRLTYAEALSLGSS